MLITRSEILQQCQRDKAAFDRIPKAMRNLLLHEMSVARRALEPAPEQVEISAPKTATA